MVDNRADGIRGTGSGAGIEAFVTRTSQVAGAVQAGDALGSAATVRVAVVLRNACAYSVVALGIGAAGGGVAWIIKLNG